MQSASAVVLTPALWRQIELDVPREESTRESNPRCHPATIPSKNSKQNRPLQRPGSHVYELLLTW